MSLLIALPILAFAGASPLTAWAPYDPAVPNPTRTLGYEAGRKHTLYMDQERAIQAIVAKSPSRATIEPYGASTEGRPLRIVVLASPENRKRLAAIRADMQTLADGTVDQAVIRRTPTIVWINQAIHGDEAASFESAMWLVYNLCASRHPDVVEWLKETVVIVNPCYNADGRERFATWANSVARGDSDPLSYEQREPRSVNGRVNHFRFDLNRDRVSMSQSETQQEIAAFLKWNPQAYVDQHGEVETYHFPPAALSIHARVDRARYHRWADVYGRETARAFDAQGYPYYVKDIFDLYYPGYTDSWATLSGAIGMTHETNAQMIAREDSDGVLRTLLGGMERHLVAAMAVIKASAKNREQLLRSFAEFKRKGASGELAGARKAFVATASEPERLNRIKAILNISGVKADLTYGRLGGQGTSVWTAKQESLPSQARYVLTVPLAQPQAAIALTMLETDSNFEKAFVEEQLRRMADSERAEFYDLTGWSLPLVHGVDAWWLDRMPVIARDSVKSPKPGDSPIGWAIRPGSVGAMLTAKLLASGVRVQLSPIEMKVGGQTYPSGTYLVLTSRNDEATRKRMAALVGAEPFGSAYPDSGRASPGGEEVVSLRPLKIGVLFGEPDSPADFGSAWFVFERELKLPFTALSGAGVRRNLDSFSAIVAPEGADVAAPQLREWIQGGGCLILLGGDPNRGSFLKLESTTASSIPGSLFRAVVEPDNFLSYGLEGLPAAALVSGTRYFKPPTGKSAVSVADVERTLLSGWAWPERTEKAVRGTTVIHAEPVGRGRVVWFAADPTDRALLAGHWGFLMNAIVNGPRR